MTTSTQTKDDKKKFANLLGPTDAKVDREVREKLITARVGLLLRASFFGNLATRLKLVNADEWCGTAATDGRNLYYNSRFIKMLRPKEIEFLFGKCLNLPRLIQVRRLASIVFAFPTLASRCQL